MKKKYVIALILASLLGCGLHFLYEWLPHALTALFSPVNESPWEHLKLLFWPTLLASAVLAPRAERPESAWGGFFLAQLVMPLFMLGVFYGLLALGLHSLWGDIVLYFVTMAGGFWLAYGLRKSNFAAKWGGALLMLLLLYAASLVLFTFAAPDCFLFRELTHNM